MAPPAAMELQAGETIAWSWPVVAAILYVALLPSLLSYFIYNHATGIVGPASAGQAITLMPLFGAVIAAVLLGERLHGFHFIGMVFILAGIALSLISARRQQPAGAAKSAGLEDRA
jgi:drug/metabolite transporter (DMT)-like permease